MGTTIWSPLASGVLSGKYLNEFPSDTRLGIQGLEWLKERALKEDRIEKVKQIKILSDELGLPLPVFALAWCLKNPNVSTVILGASKVSQLKENFEAVVAMQSLTPDIMDKLETILKNKPVLPEY